MDAFDSLLRHELLKKIKTERAERIEHLAAGRPTSWDDYKRSVGYLSALADVETWVVEIERALSQPQAQRGR